MKPVSTIAESASNYNGSEPRRIDYLDGWRGLAITFVLLAHFTGIKGIDLGRLGVDVFFVLSGMLMSNILFVKRVPLGTFYQRRISRVFPVFIIFIVLVYGLSHLFGTSAETKNFPLTLLFLRSYFPASEDIWNTGIPVGHIWSLNVEEHCYILLSLITLFVVLKKREHIALFLLGFLAMAINYIYVSHPEYAPAGRYDLRTEVVMSHLMLSAGYFLICKNFKKYIHPLFPVAAFVLAIFCYTKLAPWHASWTLSPILLAFTVNHLSSMPALAVKFLSLPPLRLIGIWSYSIYLWQQPYYKNIGQFGSTFLSSGLTLLSLSIFTGVISFYVIENPTRKWLNSNWGRVQATNPKPN